MTWPGWGDILPRCDAARDKRGPGWGKLAWPFRCALVGVQVHHPRALAAPRGDRLCRRRFRFGRRSVPLLSAPILVTNGPTRAPSLPTARHAGPPRGHRSAARSQAPSKHVCPRSSARPEPAPDRRLLSMAPPAGTAPTTRFPSAHPYGPARPPFRASSSDSAASSEMSAGHP